MSYDQTEVPTTADATLLIAAPRPSVARIGLTLLGLAALSASCIKGTWALAEYFAPKLPSSEPYEIHAFIFLLLALAICLPTPLRCGLRLGSRSEWRHRWWQIALVFALPPLAVITIYANFTSRPYSGYPMSMWLTESIAQELLFSGFIYARCVGLFGVPSLNSRGAFAFPLLITPAMFALWHWPNMESLPASYMAFQFVYVFLGCWWTLQMRRWTGSVLPGAANHVLVNYLASVV